ncbi:head decoration protein [Glycomyces sp. NPDC021274]|uniref:head decoration protein n=1 Tax=Glycomyces sp. NPDC021274 TaxID=3155120 RepID=UPI0033DB3517
MDISVRTTTYGVENRSWLGSAHGTEATRTVTLDVSAFTEATHYPDGFIPSGVVLGRITASGLYGPYDNAAADGRQTAAGFLFNSTTVNGTADLGAPLLEHGMVIEDKLPADSGYDAAAGVELAGRIVVR